MTDDHNIDDCERCNEEDTHLRARVSELEAELKELQSRKVRCWVVVYKHRHDDDLWPVFQDEQPKEADIIKELGDLFEPERGERIEFVGPFDCSYTFALGEEPPGGVDVTIESGVLRND